MRITLRTLLAFVDQTLSPEDMQDMQQRIDESPFATQVVRQLRVLVAASGISAPDPNASDSMYDANWMSCYLDSQLSSELVAKFEAACLDSTELLAEAAACHQVLPIALNEPAEISESLRQRIVDLEHSGGQVPAATSRKQAPATPSASRPEAGPNFDLAGLSAPDHQELPELEAPSQSQVDELAQEAPPAAGSPTVKPKSASDEKLEQRIASRQRSQKTLIIGLSCTIVILLAIGGWMLFNPPGGRTVAKSDNNASATEIGQETETAPNPTDSSAEDDQSDQSDVTESNADNDTVPPDANPSPSGPEADAADVSEDTPPQPMPVAPTPEPAAAEDAGTATEDAGVTPAVIPVSPVKPAATPDAAVAMADLTPDNPKPVLPSAPKAGVMPDPNVDVPPDVAPADTALGTLLTAGALVGARNDKEPWQLIREAAIITAGTRIACAPYTTAAIVTEKRDQRLLTLYGPSQVRIADGQDLFNFNLALGRVTFQFDNESDTASVTVSGRQFVFSAAAGRPLVGLQMRGQLAEGQDPLVAENHNFLLEISVVGGTVDVRQEDKLTTLESQQSCEFLSANAAFSAPAAIDQIEWAKPGAGASKLDMAAAKELYRLIEKTPAENLNLGLISVLNYRRPEVVAQAGLAMICLDDPSAYFGVQGLLSMPRQRLYWERHLLSLRGMLARSVDGAKQLQLAISGGDPTMENPEAKRMLRLIRGYTQQELEQGGDKELVSALESSTVAVRVLASENLRQINENPPYFAPEEESEARREGAIKIWNTRLSRGLIRYPEPEAQPEEDNPEEAKPKPAAS